MQRVRTSTVAAVAVGVMVIAGIGIAAQATKETKQPAAAGKHVMFSADELKWGPGPEGLPSGIQVAALDGNPEKAGMFTIRAKMPDGYMIPPHFHPTDETVTVISGTVMLGMGPKADESAMHTMNAAAFAKMPARTNHYLRAKGETIIQVSARGPFQITYVNPSDDPRKKTAAKK